ncbi:efflux RND transporter permease subunit [Acuticoccus sp. I52.16.1]|uniref:efflux RND transporter permease subunit n=1 Tax=Acuticoccus sp. I52.16.1 TaxID=2928472 RepID=UPI001FD48B01|nr:efflux RND transporter permease subunit [Acuticoccus sp. I52.16.1]UOM32767.1 efflux RND transporter permease subunit [Acuticoccus sp. I52.16.1]
MNGLINGFARHPNAANLLMALMLGLGIYALAGLTTRFWPPANLNEVEVSIAWPGASAEDVSQNILTAVEPAVRYLVGVDSLRSIAREGSAFTSIEFEAGTDMQKAYSDVEQAIDAIDTLPDGAERPKVAFDTLRDPVAKISVSGPFSEAALQTFARRIRDDLLARDLEKVTIGGARDREIVVDAREHDLLRLGLTVEDLAEAVRANTLDRPSGVVEGVIERQVRVIGGGETPEAIAGFPVKALPSGEVITIRDVARVYDGFERGSVSGLRGGNPAIELTIERAPTADALTADRAVRAYMAEVRPTLPPSLDLKLYDVRTEMLWDRISILVTNGWQGLAVVLAVLFVFLNARIAFWVALGIPVAFAGTLAVMLATGQSLNMVSLFALIMMLGVIVDDAIVVGEHADTLAARGLTPSEAATRGATEMLVPVLASSVTTIASFAPIFLMRDVMGQMMSALPLVGIAIIVASLIECFLVLPGHLAHQGGGSLRIGRFLRLTVIAGLGAAFIGGVVHASSWLLAHGTDAAQALAVLRPVIDLPPTFLAVVAILSGLALAGWVERRLARRAARLPRDPLARFRAGFDRVFNAFRDGAFTRFVRLAYAFRYTTLALAVASVMVVVYGLYLGGGHVRFVFFPSPESEFVTARVEFHPGTPRERAIAGIQAIEAALRDTERDLAQEGDLVADAYALIGRAGRDRGDNLATLQVQLTPSELRAVRTPDLVRAWREALPDLAGVKSASIAERRGGPPGRDLDLRLVGASPSALKLAATDVMAVVETWDGVSGVADDLPYGKPEIALHLTERGKALGFTLDRVGTQVRGAFEGEIARRLTLGPDAEEVPVRVRQRTDGRALSIDDIFLRSSTGEFVPASEVVEIEERNTFSVILRRNGVVTIAVTADVDPAVTSPSAITERVAEEVLPTIEARYGVRGEFGGRDRERRRSFEDLTNGAYLALFVIYLTLALVFGSYWRPVVIMLIIPFGAVGAILGHVAFGMNLTIVSFVGLLGLAGILVNDSIILVKRFDERLGEGETFASAAVGASADRLRAVLLTSLTTIGGLIPLLFEGSMSAEFLKPMAVTMVFGLASATVLVLVLVPCLLGTGYDIGRLLALLIGRRDQPVGPHVPEDRPA